MNWQPKSSNLQSPLCTLQITFVTLSKTHGKSTEPVLPSLVLSSIQCLKSLKPVSHRMCALVVLYLGIWMASKLPVNIKKTQQNPPFSFMHEQKFLNAHCSNLFI